jgi:hypothetical protein
MCQVAKENVLKIQEEIIVKSNAKNFITNNNV